jgi:hypothetical protein
MAQVTIYLPDAVEREVRQAAKRARKSVSAFLTDLARAHVRPTAWPAAWADLYGSWAGELPEIEDRPPESEESL